MNALDLLRKQHREAEVLFAKLAKAPADRKEAIFHQLADALAVHTVIEEKHFYPASVDGPEVEALLRASLEEHLGVKRLISDLLEIDVDDPTFDAKVNVLEEQVRHHVKEEENELFPRVQKLLDPTALDALGQTMAATAKALEGTEPRNAVPSQTLSAPPLPASKGGRRAA
jgi:hemerythrin superfamily protein